MSNYDFKCPWCGYIYDDSPIGYDGEYGYQYDTEQTIKCCGCSKKIKVSTYTKTVYTATKVE